MNTSAQRIQHESDQVFKDADGIVTLTFDDPDQSVNTMSTAVQAAFQEEVITRLEANRYLGVILTSAKKTFYQAET